MKSSPYSTALDLLCELVVLGKQSAQELGLAVSKFDIKEPDFRLLRCLHKTNSPLDQKQLAGLLALSPAQVCAIVEQLGQRGFIRRQAAAGDRRRSLWEISASGYKLMLEIENCSEAKEPPLDAIAQMPRRKSA